MKNPIELERMIECTLAQPPCSAGLRLKSERALAKLFRTDRVQLRRSLRGLVKKGVLVSRHGSGTYVRKVPKIPVELISESTDVRKQIQPQDIFALVESPHTRRRAATEHRRLHLGLWSHIQSPSETEKTILDGIIRRAQESGHHVTLHSVVERTGVILSADKLAVLLKNNPCDGYLMASSAASIFYQALGNVRPPTVFFCECNTSGCQPLIQVDAVDAVVRSIHCFAEKGYSRIGLVGLDTFASTEGLLQRSYERTMSELGLEYRAVEFCALGNGAVARAVQRMFMRVDAPEALYVADDIVLRELVSPLAEVGREPGRNLALITLACRGNRLPPGYDWSRMEFNPFSVGRMAVDSLLRAIGTAGEELVSFSHQATWWEGKTIRRTERTEGTQDIS